MPEDKVSRMDTMGNPDDSRTAGHDAADPGVLSSLTFRRSASFAQFAAALAAAQGEIEGAAKGAINPHFKNRYADLAAVWDACRAPLSKHGIAVLQPPCATGPSVTVTTLMVHKSGEWIESDLTMTAGQNTPQGIGSCITYARRYALQAMVGIAPEDDDGNAASTPGPRTGSRESEYVELPPERAANGGGSNGAPPPDYRNFVVTLEAEAVKGMPALMALFNTGDMPLRRYLTTKDGPKWEAIKARAQKGAAA